MISSKICAGFVTQLCGKQVGVSTILSRFLTSITQVHSQKIDKNLELRSPDPILNPRNRRPLVVLFGWMLVQPKHLNKFGDVYLEKGFDVLSVQVKPTQILLPTQAKIIVQKILNYIEFDRNSKQPVIVHGFSVGGYLHGELLVKLNADTTTHESARNRLIGQIFDSPVDLNGIPRGFAQVLLRNRFLQSGFEFVLQSYLNMFKKSITAHYDASQEQFIDNVLHVPSLYLYSTADPITNAPLIDQVVAGMKAKNIPVFTKSWSDSGHVLHMKKHPEEYLQAVNEFIDKLDIPLDDCKSVKRAECE